MSVLSNGARATSGFKHHRGPVTSTAALSGGRVATGAYDGAVAVFGPGVDDVCLLGYHDHLVNSVCAHLPSGTLASCSSDYEIHLWRLADGRRIQVLRGHADDVEAFLFLDASTGVSASRDHTLCMWDLASGRLERRLSGHMADVLSVATDGRHLYSSGDDMTLRTWNLNTGEQIARIDFDCEVDSCAIDPVRRRAILGADDGVLRVLDTDTGALIAEVPAHEAGIKKVAVCPQSGRLLSAAYDQRIVIWESSAAETITELESVSSTWERSLTWSVDGSTVIAGTFDGTVVTWDPHTGLSIGETGQSPGNPCFNDVATSVTGRVATVSDDGIVRLAQSEDGQLRWGPELRSEPPRVLMNAVALDGTGSWLASGAHDHQVHIFDLNEPFPVGRRVPLGQGPVNTLAFVMTEAGAEEVFAGTYKGYVAAIALDGVVRVSSHIHDGAVKVLRLLAGQDRGVSGAADGSIALWSRSDLDVSDRLIGHNGIVNDLDVDPDGIRVASIARDFLCKVFDLESGRLQASIFLGRRSPKSVLWLQDDRLAIGDYWGGLLDVRLDGTVHRRQIAANGISSLSLHPSGFLAASYDGTVTLLSSDFQVLDRMQAMTQRAVPAL